MAEATEAVEVAEATEVAPVVTEYWVPPRPEHHRPESDPDKRIEMMEENSSGSNTVKKFAIGLVVVFLIFAILWWIWMSLCSGTEDDTDESDEGTFCQLMDGAANAMNDITAGVTYITTHLLLVAAMAVTGLAAFILCKLGTCVTRISDYFGWSKKKSRGEEEEPPEGGTTEPPETEPAGKDNKDNKNEDEEIK